MMKPGDIVICIDRFDAKYITRGKKYTILFIDDMCVDIICDNGYKTKYLKCRFKSLNRREKLERILK